MVVFSISFTILLIEAGIEEPAIADVPAFANIVGQSNLNWGYRTQPEPQACIAFGGCSWPRGKVMGGSSVLNYMVYIRGNKRDYDEWEALGNPGWGYDDVLYYFKKSERNRDFKIAQDMYYHNSKGPLNVEWFPYQDRNVPIILDAFYHAGYPHIDVNADEQLGSMRIQTTSKDGVRQSTNIAFIRPIRDRPNLTIIKQAFVTRILIDKETNNAFGVEFLKDGKLAYVVAHKEVILSGGAINSVQTLKVSGIGPKEELESLGIPVHADLPVGKNLQDHISTMGLIFGLTNYSSTLVSEQQKIDDAYKFYHKHRGPLAATGVLQLSAFYRTIFAHYSDVPDIQILMLGVNLQDIFTEPSMPGLTPLSYYNALLVAPLLLHPKSRGEILLNKTDPVFGLPLIYPKYLTEYPDLDTIVEGIMEVVRIFETTKLKRIATLIRIPLPGCIQFEYGTREYWECIVMFYTQTIYHPSGTNKMGPKGDKTAVVDHELRVYGVRRLRVIDASIMPLIPSGNINAPTIMIAEKGSDMIKHTWLR